MSSRKGTAGSRISGSKVKMVSLWKIATALVQPCGIQVSHLVPTGVEMVVRLREASSKVWWSYLTKRSRTV